MRTVHKVGRFGAGFIVRSAGVLLKSPNLRHANGDKTLRIAPSLSGRVHHLRIYDRCLRTSEAVGNYQAGFARN